ncbi:hypothetical protein [Lentzea kentuckyensis]|uniref:hypothetical protein n=1 Tax=Lentzea kentuckyensis TaxID=360086 RepID=UPI000A39E42C|nr:hypothetical protein [Lentzea kentuckyensis]
MSEQGPTPPPQEPSSNDPQAARPAPDQATTPLPAEAPATPGQQPAPEQPAATAAEPPPAATAAEPPPAAAPAAAPAAPIPSAAAPAGRGRARRFAGHRATQLVAVGLLGLVLGGGIVGAIAANRFDHRGGPGHVRMYERGDRGPDRGDRGDRFEQRGPFDDRGDRFER